jgi:hypothetical protein
VIPSTIQSGTDLIFTTTNSTYPASDFTLIYYLINGSYKYTITATADGDDYNVEVLATSTGLWAAGDYHYFGFVSDATNTYKVEEGTTTIIANPVTASIADLRSHARTMLDAIEAVLENRAGADVAQYSIAGRQVIKIPIPELITLRNKYKAEVAAEDATERIAKGLDGAKQVLVRFV